MTLKQKTFFARRSIPGKAGQQTKELFWTIKDVDGTQLGSPPYERGRTDRLLARGRAMRDLQALLTGADKAAATDILKAFALVCWVLPLVEGGGTGHDPHKLEIGDQICTKTGGHPLDGFSGCRASVVYASLPKSLKQGVSSLTVVMSVIASTSNKFSMHAKLHKEVSYADFMLA